MAIGERLTSVWGRLAVCVATGSMAACGAGKPAAQPATAAASPATAPPVATPPGPTASVQLGTVYLLGAGPAPVARPGDDRAERLAEALRDLDGVEGVGVLGTGGVPPTTTLRGSGGGGGSIGSGLGGGGGSPGGVSARRPPPQVQTGVPVHSGALDKSIIQRIVRQSLSRIRYCYERELLHDPNLAGRVDAHFEIESDGSVSRVSATGISPAVATCIEGVLRQMRFPRPPGGGRVLVRYPFNFATAAGTGPSAPVGDRLVEVERGCRPLDTGGAASAFAPIEGAAEACYHEALGRVPELTGRALVEVTVDDQGAIANVAVEGPGDAALEACVADATRALSLTGDQRVATTGRRALFTLAFTREPAPGLESDPEVALIYLTRRDVRVGLRILASEVPLDRDTAPHRAAWREIATAVRGLKGPVVLRAADDVDALVVEMALRTLPAARVRLARAVADRAGAAWKIVTPLADLDLRGRCGGPPEGRNSVMVARDGYWIGTDKGYEHVPLDGKELDSIGFARHLRELRRFELAGRSDLEIAAAAGTSYGALARAVDIAFETGFTDVRVLRVSQLRDPRQLRRRPP